MPDFWIDQQLLRPRLAEFFADKKRDISRFGSTVNQTFEAFVFASVVGWYRQRGWHTEFIHPHADGPVAGEVRLKFSTRGRPDNYTYVLCRRNADELQIRHQLRVATCFHREGHGYAANVCLDVAVIAATDLESYSTDTYLPNQALITFGEAKHMSAFAELIASFLGLVHELQPRRLRAHPGVGRTGRPHLPPFLYVSGRLLRTAEGVIATIKERRYDVLVFDSTHALSEAVALPLRPAPLRPRRKKST